MENRWPWYSNRNPFKWAIFDILTKQMKSSQGEGVGGRWLSEELGGGVKWGIGGGGGLSGELE